MSTASTFARRFAAGTVVALSALMMAACSAPSPTKEVPRLLGTFPMGDRVQVGALIYTVLETSWRTQLTPEPGSQTPKNRFLIVKLTITNAGKDEAAIPQLALVNPSGESISELTDPKDEIQGWFGGLLRKLPAAQTQTGTVIFDAPMAAYKLKVTDGGDFDQEKFAYIDLPLQLQ